MKKARQVAGSISMKGDQKILYKCRNCNRTDKRAYNPTSEEQCNHCNAPMDPLEIRYKCVNCGHMPGAWLPGLPCPECGETLI